MSEESVNVVRAIYAAWLEGASARGFMDSDIEYVNPPDAVETGTLRGPKSFGLIRMPTTTLRCVRSGSLTPATTWW